MQVRTDISTVLPLRGWGALLANLGLLASALILPAVAHLLGAPVRWFLPMHWPVVLAGLVYGWRGGLAVGALAPLVSFALSGMPPLAILPVMVVELAVYGFLAGFLRERLSWSGYLSAGLALVTGRLVYMGLVALLAPHTGGYWSYIASALLPGTTAGAGMFLLLPPLSRRWVDHEP
ncbi:ECF transporter S component [bacterium]|nr:ECF transporter S component [bacterium]